VVETLKGYENLDGAYNLMDLFYIISLTLTVGGFSYWTWFILAQTKLIRAELKEAKELLEFKEFVLDSCTDLQIPNRVMAMVPVAAEIIAKLEPQFHLSAEYKRTKAYKMLLDKLYPELKGKHQKWMAGLAIELAILKDRRGTIWQEDS